MTFVWSQLQNWTCEDSKHFFSFFINLFLLYQPFIFWHMSKKEYFVIWDLDGTLLDTEGVSTKVIETVTKDYLPDDYIIDPYIWIIYWISLCALKYYVWSTLYNQEKNFFHNLIVSWFYPSLVNWTSCSTAFQHSSGSIFFLSTSILDIWQQMSSLYLIHLYIAPITTDYCSLSL